MTRYEKPSWRSAVLVGALFLVLILVLIVVDDYRVDRDKDLFCENLTGTQMYPVCERNSFKMCHGKSDATIFLDCGDS